MTQPVFRPTNVTDVGRKLSGTGGGVVGVTVGVGVAFRAAPEPVWPRLSFEVAEGEPAEGAPLADGFWLTCSTDVATRGTTTTAAATAAATVADTATCRYRRRRTRRLIRSNVPGGGGSGAVPACSRRPRSPCGSLCSSIGFPHGGLEPVPGLEQVGLDRAFRAPQQRGHLAHAEP